MDQDFLARAQRVTSFNLTSADFESLTYKREIQSLFVKYYFPRFDLSHTLDTLDVQQFNAVVDRLRSESPEMLQALLKYPLKAKGPGEVLMFFIINPAYLAGLFSPGMDVRIDPDQYEVKAATISRGHATNFKLGSAVPLASLMSDIAHLYEHVNSHWPGTLPDDQTETEICGSAINALRRAAPDDFACIEAAYAKASYDYYFKAHPVVVIHNTGKRCGHIEKVGYVAQEDITIERLTNGTLKPRIRL